MCCGRSGLPNAAGALHGGHAAREDASERDGAWLVVPERPEDTGVIDLSVAIRGVMSNTP